MKSYRLQADNNDVHLLPNELGVEVKIFHLSAIGSHSESSRFSSGVDTEDPAGSGHPLPSFILGGVFFSNQALACRYGKEIRKACGWGFLRWWRNDTSHPKVASRAHWCRTSKADAKDVYLSPKELDEKVTKLHLPAFGAANRLGKFRMHTNTSDSRYTSMRRVAWVSSTSSPS